MEGEYFEKHPDTTCIVAPDQVGLTKKSNASLDPRTNYTDLHDKCTVDFRRGLRYGLMCISKFRLFSTVVTLS